MEILSKDQQKRFNKLSEENQYSFLCSIKDSIEGVLKVLENDQK